MPIPERYWEITVAIAAPSTPNFNSMTPLIFLAVSAILNIALDLFFVIVLKLGVEGAAIATVISQ